MRADDTQGSVLTFLLYGKVTTTDMRNRASVSDKDPYVEGSKAIYITSVQMSTAQGACVLKFLEEMLPILVVPGGPHSLVLRTCLNRLVLLHNGSDKPPHKRQVFCCIVVTPKLWSSLKVTLSTQWRPFSIFQCWQEARRIFSASAARLLIR